MTKLISWPWKWKEILRCVYLFDTPEQMSKGPRVIVDRLFAHLVGKADPNRTTFTLFLISIMLRLGMLLRRCMPIVKIEFENYVSHVLGTKLVQILEHLQSNFLSAAVIMVTIKVRIMTMEACCVLSFIRILSVSLVWYIWTTKRGSFFRSQ